MRHVTTGVLVLCLCLGAGISSAQDSKELLAEITKVDAELFEAFNTCDLKTSGAIFAKDLEFYHDITGLGDYEQTMEATKTNCDRSLGLRRELVEESHEVHPIGNDGAVQIGKHTFCHPENGEDVCGTFDFVHVWRRVGDGWKLARVISYGH